MNFDVSEQKDFHVKRASMNHRRESISLEKASMINKIVPQEEKRRENLLKKHERKAADLLLSNEAARKGHRMSNLGPIEMSGFLPLLNETPRSKKFDLTNPKNEDAMPIRRVSKVQNDEFLEKLDSKGFKMMLSQYRRQMFLDASFNRDVDKK